MRKVWGEKFLVQKILDWTISGTPMVVYSLSRHSGGGGMDIKNNWVRPPILSAANPQKGDQTPPLYTRMGDTHHPQTCYYRSVGINPTLSKRNSLYETL